MNNYVDNNLYKFANGFIYFDDLYHQNIMTNDTRTLIVDIGCIKFGNDLDMLPLMSTVYESTGEYFNLYTNKKITKVQFSKLISKHSHNCKKFKIINNFKTKEKYEIINTNINS